ncbi:hypothetical protein SteCoe_8242 [Stentor coeruleus]|uniref:THH1/TOM1/TOM3 domain-containing protein n=1 Tax=Stentor coeruleus TaxID=5963 RepID=A0A1R2CKI9_9CILI|nr:hypothetical protein SteCoe_8242 [Stentor coeruleus]
MRDQHFGLSLIHQSPLPIIFCAMYFIVLVISVWKMILTLKQPGSAVTYRQMFFYIVLAIIGILRMIWSLESFIKYNVSTYLLLDSLACVLLGLLGLTFSLLWYEMYLSSKVLLSAHSYKVYMFTAISSYILINLSSLFIHVFFIYINAFSDEVIVTVIGSLDISISFLCAILLIISGKLLMKNLKFAFDGEFYKIIIRRIRSITICSGLVYFFKTFIPILSWFYIKYGHGEYYWLDIFIVILYYIGMEVCPVFVILIILKVSSIDNNEEDLLPSILLSNDEQMCKNRESSRKILSKRLLISYSESKRSFASFFIEKEIKSCPSKPAWAFH